MHALVIHARRTLRTFQISRTGRIRCADDAEAVRNVFAALTPLAAVRGTADAALIARTLIRARMAILRHTFDADAVRRAPAGIAVQRAAVLRTSMGALVIGSRTSPGLLARDADSRGRRNTRGSGAKRICAVDRSALAAFQICSRTDERWCRHAADTAVAGRIALTLLAECGAVGITASAALVANTGIQGRTRCT